jgi:hypothetical protein
MFFEDIRSERLLMRHAADRLSVRWFIGYDLDESLPDHSSLTRIRTRYGVEVFRRFFEQIVEQCQLAGLVWGRELYIDARHPSKLTHRATPSSRASPSKRIWQNCLSQRQTRGHYPHTRRMSLSRLFLHPFPLYFQMKRVRNSLRAMKRGMIGSSKGEHKIAV